MKTLASTQWFFGAFLAIVPFAHTTALRNLVFVLLVFSVLIAAYQQGWRAISKRCRDWSPIWIAWLFFLALFPIWAPTEDVGWMLSGQWGQAILIWAIGFTLARLWSENTLSLKAICCCCAAIVGAYYLQLGVAASGLYGATPPGHIPVDVTLQALRKALTEGVASWGAKVPFPFVGYDEMHGNLGYAGTQLIALCAAWYAASRSSGNIKDSRVALVIILASLLSAVGISSRGALLFDGVMLAVSYLFLRSKQTKSDGQNASWMGKGRWITLGLVVLLTSLVTGKTILKDERWQLMATKMQAGWMVDDPMDYMCHGLKAEEREKILQKLNIQDPALAEKVMLGFEQDAGRVLLMQVGWQLVKENPLGIDGSRQAYEKAIVAKCGGQPVNTFAHTHNGWMNLALSFGWLGAALYFALLVSMAYEGYKQARKGIALPWSSALFLVAFFWTIRGLTDACYQDHYLLMQGSLLGFLYMRTRIEAQAVEGAATVLPTA